MKQEEKTKLTVAKIIDAAMHEFGKNGYTGGAVNNICKSGINKGLVYHNFKDKDALYMACLEISCNKLVDYIKEKNCTSDILKYMEARMSFFEAFPDEAHIFFEAVLMPQEHLYNDIKKALCDFEKINEAVYRNTVAGLRLRDGVTMDDAVLYFHEMQNMFNAYFSSPAYRNTAFDEKIISHETNLPKLLNFMLYGIVKGDDGE